MATSILIVEDSARVRAQIIEALTTVALFDNRYEARDGIEGLKVLKNSSVDMILCDLMMPNMGGFEFLRIVKGTKELRDIPVIILSSRGEGKLKVKGLEQGASDYVTKPFEAGELIARIMVHLNIKALQDEMRKTNDLLKELSITDHLTHLYNRRYMMDALEMEFQRVQRKKGELCLVLMDVDHFKLVNDTFGHQRGDVVLAAVAEAVQVELRRYDIAARYGGEEFAMVLPETSLQDGLSVAERVRKSVLGITFPSPMENLAVTISQGIASMPSPHIDSVDEMIKAADEALYRAKEHGRNRVEGPAGKA
jgi:two-component system, cell cycle response regulator